MTNSSVPLVATSNGWTPIAFFDSAANYARRERFIVWTIDKKGYERFEVAQMEGAHIVGEQRADGHGGRMKEGRPHYLRPIAFKLVQGPALDALDGIVQHFLAHFPRANRQLAFPKPRFVMPETACVEFRNEAVTPT